MKFPVFSLLSGNFKTETSSLETASCLDAAAVTARGFDAGEVAEALCMARPRNELGFQAGSCRCRSHRHRRLLMNKITCLDACYL